ncbi:MAG: hypothetical protein A3C42_00835 [Chlamydiae bacterium RIFCSPHIGHO2_02_FULL_45_9]|nr:MAG: hypothetical protein A3C42_00835 [Chlamydiae bacterium RIFCSPHIGHO2_02_FULL_45_9]
MHGGTSRGPKTKLGKERSRQAVLRHGGHTKEAKASHREAMDLIRQSKGLLRSVADCSHAKCWLYTQVNSKVGRGSSNRSEFIPHPTSQSLT